MIRMLFGAVVFLSVPSGAAGPAKPAAEAPPAVARGLRPHGPCAPDVRKFCPDAVDLRRRARCLRAHADELSEACRTARSHRLNALKDFKSACESDIAKVCGGVRSGGGAILKCLRENSSKLSEKCRRAAAGAHGKIERPHRAHPDRSADDGGDGDGLSG